MSNGKIFLTNSEILKRICEIGGRVHFLGVGGVSMCSLFCLSCHFGIECSGSDRRKNKILEALMENGADISIGERGELPVNTALLVYSHAIPTDHSERIFARQNGILELSRAEYMGALMMCYDRRIGVSGSHGKSTVTAMLTKIFDDAGLNPTSLSGANLLNSELPFRLGSLDYLIYEACEYKDSFLSFSPTTAVFLNMELDHTDYFPDETALALSFRRAIERSAVAIVNSDDAKLIKACEGVKTRIITVGTSINADYRYEVISSEPRKMRFKMFLGEKELGEIKLSMLGEFNISNAAAATVAALENGVNFSDAAAALESFYGIERRLEKIGSYEQRDVYYDYAHHPTEIRESVRALRSIGNEKITVIFRPHTYSRTAALWDEFKKSFSYADYLILNPIDAIREKPLSDVDSERLANECGAFYACDASQTVELINRTEGIILLMGAADVEEIKKMLTNSGV